MVRGLVLAGLLALAPSIAMAQQPCTTDARQVVNELYRHMLERGADAGSQGWVDRLNSGTTVREIVRQIAQSPEHMSRFHNAGEGATANRNTVATLYRHILGRQPDGGGLESMTNLANQRGMSAVVDQILNSEEYTRTYGDWGVPGSGGITFCGSRNNTAQNTANVDRSQMRFADLDRNRNGMIERNEWRGSPRSFQIHDWNNDGVLSGDEVEAGRFRQGRNAEYEDYDRGEDFAYLDVNNNNRIERREWHAGARAFDDLDRNGDGVLTRAEFARGSGTAATAGQSIAVAADRQWTDTGINVNAGDMVTINADGRIRLARDTNDFVTAQGSGGRVGDATMPNAPVGGLVARFGNSAPVFIGQSRTLRVPRSGRAKHAAQRAEAR